MSRVVYPGTFDPITNGHLDIIQRAMSLFDEVIIAVAQGQHKQTLFSLEQRLQMIETIIQGWPGESCVSVRGFDCLLVDFCQQHQVKIILRGLRAVSDFEYEFQLSGMNKNLHPEIETLFLPATEKNHFISSSLVKEVCRMHGDIDNFVPANVKAELLRKLR